MLVAQMEAVLLSCNCQHDTAQGHLKEESQLRDCSDSLASSDVCGEIATANWRRRAQPTVGSTILWPEGPGLYKKAR